MSEVGLFQKHCGQENVISCGSTYCTCSACCVMYALRKSDLEMIEKPNHAAERALSKVLGRIRTIFMEIFSSFLN